MHNDFSHGSLNIIILRAEELSTCLQTYAPFVLQDTYKNNLNPNIMQLTSLLLCYIPPFHVTHYFHLYKWSD